MQITFENSQFEQGIELRKLGVNIPDNVLVKHSNLADKAEILDQMEHAQAPPPDPLMVAKAGLADAQAALAKASADKTQASTVTERVTSQFSAVQAGQAIAATPAIAPLADQLLKSSGFADQDAPPIVGAGAVSGTPPPGLPLAPPGPTPPPPGGVPPNTSPAFPAKPVSPAKGLNKGIEGAGKP